MLLVKLHFAVLKMPNGLLAIWLEVMEEEMKYLAVILRLWPKITCMILFSWLLSKRLLEKEWAAQFSVAYILLRNRFILIVLYNVYTSTLDIADFPSPNKNSLYRVFRLFAIKLHSLSRESTVIWKKIHYIEFFHYSQLNYIEKTNLRTDRLITLYKESENNWTKWKIWIFASNYRNSNVDKKNWKNARKN